MERIRCASLKYEYRSIELFTCTCSILSGPVETLHQTSSTAFISLPGNIRILPTLQCGSLMCKEGLKTKRALGSPLFSSLLRPPFQPASVVGRYREVAPDRVLGGLRFLECRCHGACLWDLGSRLRPGPLDLLWGPTKQSRPVADWTQENGKGRRRAGDQD